MEFNADTLFEGVQVKRGNDDEPVIGEVLIYEQEGQIGVLLLDAQASCVDFIHPPVNGDD